MKNDVYTNFHYYLKKYEGKHPNPWKEKGFSLWFADVCCETDGYEVKNVSIRFKNKKIYYEFLEEDLILAAAIITRSLFDNWGPADWNVIIKLNGKTIRTEKTELNLENQIEVFNFIIVWAEKEKNDFYEIVLEFEDENSYDHQMLSIFYIVDKDHDDDYYLNKEGDRRLK